MKKVFIMFFAVVGMMACNEEGIKESVNKKPEIIKSIGQFNNIPVGTFNNNNLSCLIPHLEAEQIYLQALDSMGYIGHVFESAYILWQNFIPENSAFLVLTGKYVDDENQFMPFSFVIELEPNFDEEILYIANHGSSGGSGGPKVKFTCKGTKCSSCMPQLDAEGNVCDCPCANVGPSGDGFCEMTTSGSSGGSGGEWFTLLIGLIADVGTWF